MSIPPKQFRRDHPCTKRIQFDDNPIAAQMLNDNVC